MPAIFRRLHSQHAPSFCTWPYLRTQLRCDFLINHLNDRLRVCACVLKDFKEWKAFFFFHFFIYFIHEIAILITTRDEVYKNAQYCIISSESILMND